MDDDEVVKAVRRAFRRLRTAQRLVSRLRLALAAERSRSQRLGAENYSLGKKVERLSLRIIELWGETTNGRSATEEPAD